MDEARHGGAYLKYMKKSLKNLGASAQLAFAKIGVLMASASRHQKALHPTNLHVNKYDKKRYNKLMREQNKYRKTVKLTVADIAQMTEESNKEFGDNDV